MAVDQLLAGRLLQQERRGAGPQRLRRPLGIVVHRQHDDLAVDALGFQPGQHVEPAQARHRQVGDDHVRPQPPRRLDELLAVAHRADDVEVVLLEQADEAFLDDRVVVGDEDGGTAR